MSDSLTWLHISDLHCRPKETGWDAREVLNALRADLEKLASKQRLRPDLIFFTGDAVYGQIQGSSIRGQFAAAEEFFEGIRTTCNVKRENVFLVPGNHDVHRGKVSPAWTEWLDTRAKGGALEDVQKLIGEAGPDWRAIMVRLGEYRRFLGKIGYEHLLQDRKRLIYAARRRIHGIEVAIAGLNSAWSCGRDDEKGRLWLAGDWQVATLKPRIEKAEVVIGLVHHPRSWFVTAEDPDVESLFERVFDFHLHGHEHKLWVKRTDGHVRIAAGACYDRSDRPNGYNLVKLDFENEKAEVWLRQYEKDAGAWQQRVIKPWTDDHGVRHLDNLRCFKRRPKVTAAVDGRPAADAPTPETDEKNTETRFLDAVFDALARNPIVLLLAQEGRVERETIAAIKARASKRCGEEGLLHVTPPPCPEVTLGDYFAWLAAQCGFAESAHTSTQWASNLDQRLQAGGDLFLLVNGFEKGSTEGRRRLSMELRSLSERHGSALWVVLCGGEQLAALKYEHGEESLLNLAERLDWPEPGADDVIAWQQRGFPDLELGRQDAEDLLKRCGGDRRLVRICLEHRRRGDTKDEAKAFRYACEDLYTAVFQAYSADPKARKKICGWLRRNDLGPHRPWIQDPLLRRLYWRNALTVRDRRLEWRCEAIRDLGRRVLKCE